MTRWISVFGVALVFACSQEEPPPPGCGDFALDEGEACDDGNNVDGDGCEANCQLPLGSCGDGFVDADEGCDDGNLEDGDACHVDCTLNTCRDGLIDPGELCYGAPREILMPGKPQRAALGDMDGDEDLDLVTADSSIALGDNVSVFLNDGAGAFSPTQRFAIGLLPGALVLADLDGDSDLDVATSSKAEDKVSILKNNGAGALAPQVTFPTGRFPVALIADDIDGDRDIDLLTADNLDDAVSVLRNNGAGAFSVRQTFPVGLRPTAIAVGDFLEGSRLELAVATTDSKLNVFSGFEQQIGFVPTLFRTGPIGVFPSGLATIQRNDFSLPSLALIDPSDSVVSVLKDLDDLEEELVALPPISGTAAGVPSALATADLDSDGFEDIAAINTSEIVVLKNDRGFGYLPQLLSLEVFGTSIQAGDLNGDTVPDLVVVDTFDKALLFLSEP